MTTRTLVSAACAIAAAGAAITGSAAPASANSTVKIVDHNVEKRTDAIEAAVDKARSINAEGIALQEVCRTQYDRLVTTWGGSWSLAWDVSRPGNCPDGSDVGTVAIWTGGTGGKAQHRALTEDPGRTPHLTCVKYRSSPYRHICSTQLVAFNGSVIRPQQTRDIKRIAADWTAKGHAVFIGGDFNTPPHRDAMDSLYATNGSGQFIEANQLEFADRHRGGKDTSPGRNQKIDYVFFSKNRTVESGAGGIQLFSTRSDHKMLVGRATVNY